MHRSLFALGWILGCAPVTPQVTGGDVGSSDPAESADVEPPPDPPAEAGEDDSHCGLIDLRLPATETAYLAQGTAIDGERPRCEARIHAIAGAKGSTLQIHLAAEPPHTVTVTDLLGSPVPMSDAGAIVLDRSGEYLVRVDPTDPDAPHSAYTIQSECIAGCDLAYTRYPVVLMHGAAGFGEILGIEYFFDVTNSLADKGYLAFTPVVDPIASTEDRAQQTQAILDELVGEGQGRRFNLVGHSQGGLDARYLAGKLLDDRIKSVTTVSSPHRGTPVADLTQGLVTITGVDSAFVELALQTLTDAIGMPNMDYVGQLASLTSTGMAEFNATVPDRTDVYYASWAGRSCSTFDWDCQDGNDGEVIAPYLGMTFWIIQMAAGDNDGMCPVESAKWGEFKGTVPADHFDEVGQLVGVTTSAFSHRDFYAEVSKDLYGRGF
jgi:triacylglycerol lipase